MNTPEDIKTKILDAAKVRFRQYGFTKTTMTEIAKDCGMSAANLYRYFESKDDIGADIARYCMSEMENTLRAVLKRPDLTAGKRLEAFFLELLHFTFNFFSNQSRLFDLCEFICAERSEIVKRHKEIERSFLAEILAEGNRTGEFDVPDIVLTAEMVQAAMVEFSSPPLMLLGFFTMEELERRAKGVVSLLIRGLAKR